MRRFLLPPLVGCLLVVGTVAPLWGQRVSRLGTAQLAGAGPRATLLATPIQSEPERGPVSIPIDPALPPLLRAWLHGGGRRVVIPIFASLEGRAGSVVTSRGICGTVGLALRF